MPRGKFITLEGIEGVGKTTNLEFIQGVLKQSAVEFISTREPGGTELAESIRDLILNSKHEVLDPTAELLLIFAARAQHLNKVILPALKQGKWVICDRFTDATYAYQGGGRGIATHKIQALEDLVQGPLRPDLCLILDARVEVGMERANKRSAPDRMEQEGETFFNSVRNVYLKRAAMLPKTHKLINAELPLAEVQQQLLVELQRVLSK